MWLTRAAALGLFAAGIVGYTASLQGGVFIPGSTLVTHDDLDQLEAWLGEGDLALTNIFTKTDGDRQDSLDFHAAVDGKGRTFVVLEVKAGTAYNNDAASPWYGSNRNPRQVIGGYNPLSWDSYSGYHVSPTIIERTAFLFNLTNGVKQDQSLDSQGYYQTYNDAFLGPIFGRGHDLYVATDLTWGYTYNYSYGPSVYDDNILADDAYYHYGDMFGTIEVFTIAQQQASPVPESSSLIAWSILGLVCGSGCWWRRRVQHPGTRCHKPATQRHARFPAAGDERQLP
jgi:hypothetical protein